MNNDKALSNILRFSLYVLHSQVLFTNLVQCELCTVLSAQAGLDHAGLVRAGGAMTSLAESGQQWDAPNAWPPLQALLVEGLAMYGGTHTPRAAALVVALGLRLTAAMT